MNENFSNVIPLKNGKCPICGKASVKAYHLFCSKRCADIDLGNWLNEHFEGFMHDKAMFTGNCECIHRRRIDFRILILAFFLIILI